MEKNWFNKTVNEVEENLDTNVKTGLTSEKVQKKCRKIWS